MSKIVGVFHKICHKLTAGGAALLDSKNSAFGWPALIFPFRTDDFKASEIQDIKQITKPVELAFLRTQSFFVICC